MAQNPQVETSNLTGASAPAQDTSNLLNSVSAVRSAATDDANAFKYLDDYISELDNNYQKYSKSRNNLQHVGIMSHMLKNSMLGKVPLVGDAINGFASYFESQYSDVLSKRDKYFELLNDARAKKIELQTNIANQKNRYAYEQEALKRVGIDNPYFMLRNGTLGNFSSPSLSGGSFASRTNNTDSLKIQRPSSLKDDLKELLGLLKMVKDVVK